MTEEQIKIAIAEACGWTHCRIASNVHSRIIPVGTRPLGVPGMEDYLPDYLNDLNEAAKLIPIAEGEGWFCTMVRCMSEWECVFYKLKDVPGGEQELIEHKCDSGDTLAAAICEAFLRTIGKWKEAP